VKGEITVTNPNQVTSVTADIADVMTIPGDVYLRCGGAGAYALAKVTGVTIPAKSTVVCDYYANVGADTDGINTATVNNVEYTPRRLYRRNQGRRGEGRHRLRRSPRSSAIRPLR
jgi:hypothetical protein